MAARKKHSKKQDSHSKTIFNGFREKKKRGEWVGGMGLIEEVGHACMYACLSLLPWHHELEEEEVVVQICEARAESHLLSAVDMCFSCAWHSVPLLPLPSPLASILLSKITLQVLKLETPISHHISNPEAVATIHHSCKKYPHSSSSSSSSNVALLLPLLLLLLLLMLFQICITKSIICFKIFSTHCL